MKGEAERERGGGGGGRERERERERERDRMTGLAKTKFDLKERRAKNVFSSLLVIVCLPRVGTSNLPSAVQTPT